MARQSQKHHIAWYSSVEHTYASLANTVANTLQNLLRNKDIDVLNITHRAKTQSSFIEKIRKKRYSNPKSQMTDLAGIRVVTLIERDIERDIERVSELIRTSFNVHQDASLDKSAELGFDRFGYRSVHFVCDIGSSRERLPEFQPYVGITFEIQVRTALQHAWAEIEHDRSYKFSGELPSQIKRRFYLIAGLLELADREFSLLTEELEKYTDEAHRQAQEGKLELELNSTTTLELVKVLIANRGGKPQIDALPVDEAVLNELRDFGITSLNALRDLCSEEFLSSVKHLSTTTMGLLRDAMIFSDIDRYFSIVWKHQWDGWDTESLSVMKIRYGEGKISHILQKYEIHVLDLDEDYNEDEYQN